MTKSRGALAVMIVAIFFIGINSYNKTPTQHKSFGLDTTAVELSYRASSPFGNDGGIALPASCESNVWNSNGGYHLDGVIVDPGSCASNQPPATPTLSGDLFGTINQTTSNWIESTDPEKDDIFYELDWNCSGSVDGTTGTYPSGASVPIGHTYTALGTYQVCGRAVQANDTSKKSDWGRMSIQITDGTCKVAANACGVTSGTVSGGRCVAPGLPVGYGNACSGASNVCGMKNNDGKIGCDGSCSGATAPSNTLCTCKSPSNKCAMYNDGFLNAAGTTCGASTPADSLCPLVPLVGIVINDFRVSPKLVGINKTSKLYWDVTGDVSGCKITYSKTPNGAPEAALSYTPLKNIENLLTTPITEKRYYYLTCGKEVREAIVSPFSLTEI